VTTVYSVTAKGKQHTFPTLAEANTFVGALFTETGAIAGIEAKTAMTLERAADILGSALGPGSFGFANMIKALQMLSRFNTPEEDERLAAALFAQRRAKAYHALMQKRRDQRSKRR
jgi:hypothetical protein